MAVAAPISYASAMPTGGGSAADTVSDLQSRGYQVHVNANTNAPLSQCLVNEVHGLTGSNIDHAGNKIDPTQFDTVHVNVFCRQQG